MGIIFNEDEMMSVENSIPHVDANTFEAIAPGGFNIPPAKIKAIDAAGWEDFRATKAGDIVDNKTGMALGEIDVSAHLMLRNYDFPWDDIPDNYRLMSFNYNYFVDDDEMVTEPTQQFLDRYHIRVNIRDSSRKILIQFYDILTDMRDELIAYADEAEQNCAYNEFESEFNTFFKEQMIIRYEEDPASAPWIRAPILFTIFRDLFENSYGGDYYTVVEEARKYMDSINPQTGWLQGLHAFVDMYTDLIEAYGNHIEEILAASEEDLEIIHSVESYLQGREVPMIDYVNNTTGDFPEFDDTEIE
jgi:hypothetical protein